MRNFGLNFRKDLLFRFVVIIVTLIVLLAVFIILQLTVFPDNAISNYFKKDIKVLEITPSPTAETTQKATATHTPTPIISETPAITLEPTYTPDPNASPTPLPIEENSGTQTAYIIAPSGLVVRTGPSKQHAKLGVLPYGTKVQVIKEEGAWYFIEYKEGGAYVHSNYVVIGESPPGDSTKYDYTSDIWTTINNSTKILVEKIFYDGVTIYVADIKTDAKNFLTAYELPSEKPSILAEMSQATLAINGDFFGFRNLGLVIRNGELIRDSATREAAVLYENGRLDVHFKGEKTGEQMIEDGALHAWSFGPILVKDYAAYDNFAGRSNLNPPNPRTGIGMVKPNHYKVIVADGRQENSKGLTLIEFATLFEYYECETAYNLDGGGTSIMILQNEIISSPSGGSERNCTDIIYFR